MSADVYNAAGGPTVPVAEIETGTRYRTSAYATETDYGVVLANTLGPVRTTTPTAGRH